MFLGFFPGKTSSEKKNRESGIQGLMTPQPANVKGINHAEMLWKESPYYGVSPTH